MNLMEHLEKRGEKRGKKLGQREGRLALLLQFLSAAFPNFTDGDAASLRELPDAALNEISDALALRRPWKEIRGLVREKRSRSSAARK